MLSCCKFCKNFRNSYSLKHLSMATIDDNLGRVDPPNTIDLI